MVNIKSMDHNNSSTEVPLPSVRTMQRLQIAAADGGEKTGRNKNCKRQSAFKQLRCPVSFAAVAMAIFNDGIQPARVFSLDDMAIYVNPSMDIKPKLLTSSEVNKQMKERNLAPACTESTSTVGKRIKVTDLISWNDGVNAIVYWVEDESFKTFDSGIWFQKVSELEFLCLYAPGTDVLAFSRTD